MKTMWYKSLVAIACLMVFSFSVKADVILNGETGQNNTSIDRGNCWDFTSIVYEPNYKITGNYSLSSNKSVNSANWMKSPWIKLANRNIELDAKLVIETNDEFVARSIVFSYIVYDPTQRNVIKEGDVIDFYTYNFPTPFSTDLRKLSIPLPSAIVNSDLPYKILFTCTGDKGNTTVIMDNVVIPGEYFSDPSNHCLPKEIVIDADKDGVKDADDTYPNDAKRAFNNFGPSDKVFGTLAFEDNWPAKGDYDLNDVVVNYNINRVTNAANEVVEIIGKFVTRASGAGYRNAFGFQLDNLAPEIIESVNGNKVNNINLFKYNANGLESDQQYANCIVFDDFYAVMKHPGSGAFINTSKGAPFVPYDTITVTLKLASKVLISELTPDKFNFYIVADVASGKRGREIHLSDAVPTSLVNPDLFGTVDDYSNGKQYYRTKNNLPWALNIIQGFDYPIEKVSIDKGYNYFIKWAESSGELYKTWFENVPGNRNPENIYSK